MHLHLHSKWSRDFFFSVAEMMLCVQMTEPWSILHFIIFQSLLLNDSIYKLKEWEFYPLSHHYLLVCVSHPFFPPRTRLCPLDQTEPETQTVEETCRASAHTAKISPLYFIHYSALWHSNVITNSNNSSLTPSLGWILHWLLNRPTASSGSSSCLSQQLWKEL